MILIKEYLSTNINKVYKIPKTPKTEDFIKFLEYHNFKQLSYPRKFNNYRETIDYLRKNAKDQNVFYVEECNDSDGIYNVIRFCKRGMVTSKSNPFCFLITTNNGHENKMTLCNRRNSIGFFDYDDYSLNETFTSYKDFVDKLMEIFKL